MKRTREGYISGTPAEIAELLEKHIADHKPTMHRALDMACDFMIYVQTAPEVKVAGESGVMLGPWFTKTEKELGYPIPEANQGHIHETLLFLILTKGGASQCNAWELAHAIEHACFHYEN